MKTRNHNVKSRQGVQRGVQIGLMLLALTACCVSAYRLGQLYSNWRHPADLAALRRLDATDLASFSPTMPLGGIWSFDELAWDMRSEWTSEAELEAKFAELASKTQALSDDELPAADQEFLTLAAALGVRSTELAGRQIHQLSRPGLRAQWITRQVNGRAKSCAFAVAYPSLDERWQLFEFTPKSPDAAGAAAPISHLLPLPIGAHRDGGRLADDGRVLMEFVSLEATAEALVRDWHAAGWDVRTSGLGQPGEFSYLAVRGEETIYAWSADPRGAMRNLMLVRTPTAADTGP